jgi:DNA-binding protein HU-beta
MKKKERVLAKTKTPAKKIVARRVTSTPPTAATTRTPKMPSTKLTKVQLIRFMAEYTEISPKQVASLLNLLIETATTQTRKLGEFTIPGLGKLVKAQRAARMGRNPATGEAIKIKAKTTVKFRIAKAAKDAVVPPRA